MKGKLRIFLLVFIVVSLVVLAGASYIRYTSRRIKSVKVDSVGVTTSGEVRAEGVRYSGAKDGRTEWELEADEAIYNEGDELTKLGGVSVVFFTEEGVNYTLKSKRGNYNAKAGLIEASGEVTVISTEGLTLSSESLNYSDSTGLITTNDSVLIVSKGLRVSGTGLSIDVSSRRIVVPKDVRAEITDASS